MLAKILTEWKAESGSKTPLLFKQDHKADKVCLFTSQPAHYIGKQGILVGKYEKILRDRFGHSISVDFVETNWESL